MSIQPTEVQCPYCWEMIEIEVEVLDESQQFVQDCTVCCHPIQFDVSNIDGELDVSANRTE